MVPAIHVGDTGLEILADCQEDISQAINPVFLVRAPSGTVSTWPAATKTVNGETRYLQYLTRCGDLREPGTYTIHPRFTLGDWTGAGQAGTFEVKALFA